MTKECSVEGCSEIAKCRGWCLRHYRRWRKRGGDPAELRYIRNDDLARFWSKVEKTETCWLWVGALQDRGRGQFTSKNEHFAAHRWAYRQFVGEIPDKTHLLQTCGVRNCVNPEHQKFAPYGLPKPKKPKVKVEKTMPDQKPFSEALYYEDDNAKLQVIEWLAKHGYKAWVNPDQYGIDLLGEKNGRYLGWEVEVKHNWKGHRIPFSTVHFSARKRKFVSDYHHFIMLNHERNRLLTVSGADFAKCKVVVKKTIYTQEEEFVEVPLHLCRFWEI